VTFPPKHPSRAHVLAALPPTRTLAGIEVFFASAKPRQKTDYKRLLRRQMLFFRFLTAKTKTPGSNIREFSS